MNFKVSSVIGFVIWYTAKGVWEGYATSISIQKPPSHLTPTITQVDLEHENYIMETCTQNDDIQGVYIHYIPIFSIRKTLKSSYDDSLFFISRDEGKNIGDGKILMENPSFVVNKIIALKNYTFLVSIATKSFMYLDKNFELDTIVTLDNYSMFIPHPVFPENILALAEINPKSMLEVFKPAPVHYCTDFTSTAICDGVHAPSCKQLGKCKTHPYPQPTRATIPDWHPFA
ncbi:hypothetical protein RF11_13579 [Thelohanellus kitauei]|uniref:Uncharacterized protein n=1 Tax=Thelohanellus kitauei TaxID=669202 RepID=A0A0C2N9J2_THEKT|nr:hypothetical protein RF11_13579 [Thelohanellus kitauei]